MLENPYLVFILFLIIGSYLVDTLIEWLNLNHFNPKLPKEFEGFYDEKKYETSQRYLKETTKFGLIRSTIMLPLTLGFIVLAGFNWVDQIARQLASGEILTGLAFTAIISMLAWIVSVPFSLYSTFVIEERYGFNKTTLSTFIKDTLKGALLAALLGAPVLSGIIYFFDRFGSNAWIYCWLLITVFQIFVTFIAPVVIMPLFNKFTALPTGELKTEIEKFAKEQNFKLQGIFTMDGSKRSTKANAFFTGFGKFRRIVLFDTLIEKHTTEELTAVLAHEIGHYKKKHILQSILVSILSSALMFYIFSLFIKNEGLFSAFQMEELSVYASLIFIGFLYSPISSVISVFSSILSRKNEYEADRYAAETYKKPEMLATALKKLSVDSLSNLTPHPLKVFLEYSHPPVLDRITALRKFS